MTAWKVRKPVPEMMMQLGFQQEQQWQLESMQLVNFGPFDGHHTFDFCCGFDETFTTVISGDSGTGKSTVEDAFFEVMTRNGSYNTASNEGGRGGSLSSEKRSLIGYVRGKLEDVEDENGNPVAQMLRDGSCNRWSAVVITYLSDTGTVFTVAKLFWIGAGYNANSDIRQLRLTMFKHFDPTVLASIADVAFTAERVRRVLGNEFRSYARVDEFLTYVYRTLKIDELGRGKEVMDLLAKIRSGSSFKSIAELFREQVLDVPETFQRAEEAAQSYHEHWDAYERMLDKQRQVDSLIEIRSLGDDHQKASEEYQAHVAALAPGFFAQWENDTHVELLSEHEGDLTAQCDDLSQQLDQENAKLEAQTATRDELQRQLGASGYTERLAAYEAAITRAQDHLRSCKTARDACAREAKSYFGALPDTQKGFAGLLKKAQTFVDGYQESYDKTQKHKDAATEKRLKLDMESQELRDEITYCQQHRSRIPRRLGEARDALAKAAGMDPAELPFAAELMEVTDERWRYALESVFGGFARTILVDQQSFKRFSSSIDKLKLPVRMQFRRVATDVEREVQSDPRYLSAKLAFKEDSPFSGWLANTVCDEHHDALRVDSPAQLDGPGRRVTINGQTRDGNRGAHGRDQNAEGIIGFDNTAKLDRLMRQLLELQGRWQKADQEEKRVAGQLTELIEKRGAAERLLRYEFEAVDVVGAQALLDQAKRERDEFLNDNEQLAELEVRLKLANGQVTQLTKLVGSLETRLGELSAELNATQSTLTALREQAEGWTPLDRSSDAYQLLVREGDERFSGHSVQDNLRSFEAIVVRTRQALTERKRDLARRVDTLTTRIEGRLAKYQETWPDTHLGTELSSLSDYLALLARLEAEGFHTQKDSWYEHMLSWIKEDLIPLDVAYRDARSQIDDRLEPINQILRTLPFGRDGGRLEIVCRSADPKTARDFSRLMRDLLDYEHIPQTEGTGPDAAYYRKAQKLMEIIDPTDTRAEATRRRNEVLDRRRHVRLTARVIDLEDPDKPKATYNMLASKSGGEVAEIVAFILGAALLYRLGQQDGSSKPGFAPVLLDEGFIKADSRFTSRAISAWQGFGFQLVIAVPEEKYQSVVTKARRVLNIVADADRRSYVTRLDLVERS